MSLLDVLTGGKDQEATNALEKAQQAFSNIPIPTAAQLTLPELQQYVEAGIMTPAQAQAALQSSNAYNNINMDPAALAAEKKALGQLQEVAADKGMTPEMQAQLTAALDQAQTQEHGANASILDQMAQRGIPTSLMGVAAQEANAGNEAQSNNLAATQAAGQAEQNAISSMLNSGNLAGSIQGEQYNEAANKAAAQNAMQQWNAGATNSTNALNAGMAQQANAYNAQNKQNVSNQNTATGNQRTEYNAQIPETIFGNQMQKAGGQAGVSENQANQATQQGNQMMGLIGAGIGAGANALAPAPVFALASTGGLVMDEGGSVPGHSRVPGDSQKNDTVHAMLSPGEIVVPRSIAPHPEAVKRFVQHLAHGKPPPRPVHPDDVHSVLEALTRRRAA
jgi:hypothetical protein